MKGLANSLLACLKQLKREEEEEEDSIIATNK